MSNINKKNDELSSETIHEKNVSDEKDKHKVSLSKEDLQHLFNKLGGDLRHLLTDKQEQATQVKDSCENAIKKHPFISTAIAFTCGVVLTALLKRK